MILKIRFVGGIGMYAAWKTLFVAFLLLGAMGIILGSMALLSWAGLCFLAAYTLGFYMDWRQYHG